MKYLLKIAIILGVFSQLFYYVGILGNLSAYVIAALSVVCIILLGFVSYLGFKRFVSSELSIIDGFFLTILAVVCGVNLVGALGPETAFDALWYHLTLPKLYVDAERIFFIPGGLLYYSLLPKTTEMLFIPALLFGSEIYAKLIHYVFGILTLVALYFLARLHLPKFFSYLVVCVFVTNLVFLWESITAYNDLTWAFYEVLTLYTFVRFIRSSRVIWIVLTAFFIGFSITTKLVAVETLVLYGFLLTSAFFLWKLPMKKVVLSFVILPTSLLIPLPWFLWSYLQVGNPVYPFFSGLLSSFETGFFDLSLLTFYEKIVGLFLFANDPLSPLYIMIFPLSLLVWRKFTKEHWLVCLYVIGSLILWLVIPVSGGSRFILPYLGGFSLLVGIILMKLSEKRELKKIYTLSLVSLFFVLTIVVLYRGFANAVYLPYLLGFESKQSYLSRNLNFEHGDFYDTDGFFERYIESRDVVLLIGFHNLYYISFPFVHETWYRGERISHVAIQHTELPEAYSNWNLVYTNNKTGVSLYEAPIR